MRMLGKELIFTHCFYLVYLQGRVKKQVWASLPGSAYSSNQLAHLKIFFLIVNARTIVELSD